MASELIRFVQLCNLISSFSIKPTAYNGKSQKLPLNLFYREGNEAFVDDNYDLAVKVCMKEFSFERCWCLNNFQSFRKINDKVVASYLLSSLN